MLWEPEHRGAQDAVEHIEVRIYWNAPTREDDVESEIALIARGVALNDEGTVLTPNQSLALMTPVRRALSHGLPIVIGSSAKSILAGGELSHIINDEEEGGRIAARHVALLLHGKCSIVILGINPNVAGIMVPAWNF